MNRIFAAVLTMVFSMGGSAYAHSFNVLLVGEDVQNGGAYDGFRLATKERDGHAAEESDGHLGGLDVYIFSTETAADIQQSVTQNAIDIVVLLQESPVAVDIYKLVSQSELTLPNRDDVLGQNDFAVRFGADYGMAPSEAAMRGYLAAQIIENFVRNNVEFDNR